MSIWDDIVGAISGGIGAAESGVGQFLQTRGTVEQSVNNTVPVLGAADRYAGIGVGAAGAGLGWATQKASQAVSAGAIAVNPDSKDYMHLVDAWNDAASVSPGQALLSEPSMSAVGNNPLRPWENDHTRFGQPTGTYGGIDPTDANVRAQAFESRGSLGEVASWGTDFAVQYYLNPQVLLGQAAKPLIAVGRGAAVGAGGKAAFSDKALARIGDQLHSPSEIGRAAQQMYDTKGDYLALRQHWVIKQASNPAAVASVLHASRDFDEFSTVLMSAMGDKVADAKLSAQAPALAQQLAKASDDQASLAKTVSDWNLPKITPQDTPHPAWVQTVDQLAAQNAIVRDLEARDAWLRRATGGDDPDNNGIFRAMSDQGFARLRVVNEYRALRAQQRAATFGTPASEESATGHWVGQRFNPTPGGASVRVLNWFGNDVPAGMVSLSGKGRIASRDELWASARQARLSADTAAAHIARFDAAPTATEAQNVLAAFHADSARQVFTQVFPDVKIGTPEYVRLTEAAQHYMAQHSDAVVTAMREYDQRGGYLYDDISDEYLKIPQMESQEAQLMPLPDWNALRGALLKQKDEWRKAFDNKFVSLPADVAKLGLQLWKPIVLLRIGAVPKNVGESWLASWAYLGALGNPVLGTARIAQNFASWTGQNPLNPWRMNAVQAQRKLMGDIADHTQALGASQDLYGQLVERAARNPAHYAIVGRAQHREDLAQASADIARERAVIDGLRQDIAKVSGSLVRTRVGPGQATEHAAGYAYRGSLMDPVGEVMAKNVSAGSKNDLVQTTFNTAGMQRRWASDRVAATGRTVPVAPDKPEYWDHSAHFANTNVRNSVVAMRLLQGDNPSEVADWLHGTVRGRALLHRLPAAGDTLAETDSWLFDLDTNLRALYPSEHLQAAIVDHNVTAGEVHGYLAGRDVNTLVPVLDDEMLREVDTGFVDSLNRVIDKAFQVLWTKPEDRLARIPLYDGIYRRQMNTALAQYGDRIAALNDRDGKVFIQRLESSARERALTDVQRIVYSAARRSQPASTLRYVAPFLQVTANRLSYYGSQFLENPQNMARMFAGWNAIGTTKDTDGNEVVTLSLPGFLRKVLPQLDDTPSLVFQKSSLNLINSGEPWYSPGFGPPVTIPLAAWLREHPAETPAWVKTLVGSKGLGIFPNNYYGQSWTDQFSAAWMRRAEATGGQQYANTWAAIYAQEVMKYRNGARPDMPSDEEITTRAQGLGFLRVLAAFVLPAQPTYQAGEPNQKPPAPGTGSTPRADMLATMANTHRDYLKRYGRDGDMRFYQDYPEYYDYIISMTENATGIASTNSAVARAERYAPIVANLNDPRMGALLTNVANDYGKFEADAYAWEKDRQVTPGSALLWRGANPDPKAALDNRIISRGWKEYVAAAQERDALLKLYGYTSTRSADAAWVKAIFDTKVNKIKGDTSWKDATGNQVTPWWDDYMKQDNALYAHRAQDLGRILTTPGYLEQNVGVQPWLRSASAYLGVRDQVQQLLKASADAGGSPGLGAQSNDWIAAIWEAQTKALRDADPQWAQIAASMFAHDDLTEVPGA